MSELKHLYYIYGEEEYLKNKEKKRIEAMVNELGGFVDTIKYREEKLTGDQLKGLAYVQATLFGGPRFILLEECTVTEPEVWMEYLPELENSSTYVVIVNKKLDKRTKLSAAYIKYGEIVDLESLKGKQLENFVNEWLGNNNMTMKRAELTYFINRVSDQMIAIEQELIKLRDYRYTGSDELVVITREDIDAITSETVESKIFAMIGKAAKGDSNGTYKQYHDLLNAKESPGKILILLTRQINTLLQIKDCLRLEMDNKAIQEKVGIKYQAINMNAAVAKSMSYKRLKMLLDYGVDLITQSRKGLLTENAATELMLAKCFEKQ